MSDQITSTQDRQVAWEANATTQADPGTGTQQLLHELQTLFRVAAHETFEFGMESEFVTALESSIAEHGTHAVASIATIILKGQAKPQVAAEALRLLGDVNHRESYQLRLRLLEACLDDPSRWIRDGAALGLDAMNDRHAVPSLKAAIAREPIYELRKDMESVLARLERAT